MLPTTIATAIEASLQTIQQTEPNSTPDTHRVEHELIVRHSEAFGNGLLLFTDGTTYALKELSRRIGIHILRNCSHIVRKTGRVATYNLAGRPSLNSRWEFLN